MELVQQLKEDGKAKGLCRMWQMKLKTGLDYEQLIQLYIRGIDFCISENYPTLDLYGNTSKVNARFTGCLWMMRLQIR